MLTGLQAEAVLDRLQTYCEQPGECRSLTDPLWALQDGILPAIGITEEELSDMPCYVKRDDGNWRGPVHVIELPKLQRFIDGHHDDPMTTVQVIQWMLGKEASGEIHLAPQARATFTNFLRTDELAR
jgi:hypothetical protein